MVSFAPYVFSGSQDESNQTLKRLVRNAQLSNPLTSGAAANVTVTWVLNAAVDATLTTQYRYSASPTAFAVCGGLPVNSSNSFYFASSWIYPGSGLLSGIAGFTTNASPYYYYSTNTWRVSFMTSAAAMEIHTAWYNNTTNYHVLVDGKYATPANGLNPTGAGAVRVEFSDGRKERLIQISSSLSTAFVGVWLTALDDVWAPIGSSTEPLVVFDGDSFTAGGGLSSPIDPDGTWCQQAAFRLGFKNVWQTGVSSTGYLSVGNPFPGGSLSTMRYRMQNGGWLTANPAIVIAAGGYNDVTWITASSVTQAAVVAEVVLYCRAVRAAYPRALLFMQGPFTGRRGPDADSIALDTAMAAAVAALNDPKTFYITVANAAPKAWQYGTGRVGTTAGNGNSDWTTSTDATHPTNLGHAHIATRSADAIRPLILAL